MHTKILGCQISALVFAHNAFIKPVIGKSCLVHPHFASLFRFKYEKKKKKLYLKLKFSFIDFLRNRSHEKYFHFIKCSVYWSAQLCLKDFRV